MFRGTWGELVLQVLNVLLGAGALFLLGRGLFVHDGLIGLGLILLMTSGICYVGFRFGIEQRLLEKTSGGVAEGAVSEAARLKVA